MISFKKLFIHLFFSWLKLRSTNALESQCPPLTIYHYQRVSTIYHTPTIPTAAVPYALLMIALSNG